MMGTYLVLELRNKKKESIWRANRFWNEENPEFVDCLHFNTLGDVQRDVDAVQTDPQQKHLRYILTPADWNKTFTECGKGFFKTKITLGDYLCSNMAKRILAFIEKHSDLFVKMPSEYVQELLQKTALGRHKAESCFAECSYCTGKRQKQC